jgi:hypothetical protein
MISLRDLLARQFVNHFSLDKYAREPKSRRLRVFEAPYFFVGYIIVNCKISNSLWCKGNGGASILFLRLFMKKIAWITSFFGLLSMSASALESQVSGFATAGVSVSDQSVSFDRGVNNAYLNWIGESKLGLQSDVKITHQFSMTGQVVVKQSATDDGKSDVQGEWLFGAYSVNDSTKVRMGKLRLPLFMMSEQLDVGKAYIPAKLPLEMYGQSPTNAYTGIDILKTWDIGDDSELNIQPYFGMTSFQGRGVLSAGFGGSLDAVGNYPTTFHAFEATNLAGLNVIFDYNRYIRFRAGHMTSILSSKEQATIIAGVDYVHNVGANFSSVGAELKLSGMVLTAEYGQRRVASMMFADTDGRHVTLSHRFGSFTPYIYYADISSDASKAVQGQSNMNISNLHQHTSALGVVYALDSSANIKAEISQVMVASDNNSNEFFNNASVMQGKDICVYRLNYNLIF